MTLKQFPYPTIMDRVITNEKGEVIGIEGSPLFVSTTNSTGTPDNPSYSKIVDKDGKLLFSTANPAQVNITGGSVSVSGSVQVSDGSVKVTSTPKYQNAGSMVQGEVQASEEKMIDLSDVGVSYIEIQASPDNTLPLRVGDVSGFTAFWVKPGDVRKFWHNKIYVTNPSTDTKQDFAYQAIKYS